MTTVEQIPYIDQYAGIWSIHEPTANALIELASGIDVVGHIRSVRAIAGEGRSPHTSYSYATLEGGIALVEMRGMMMKQESSMTASTSTLMMRRTFRTILADQTIRAVALIIDSPGGTVAGTEELAADLRDLNAVKPVTVIVEDLIASAAYWVGSQASAIYANATALVGSIGTYAAIQDVSAMAAMKGIKIHIIRGDGGEYKGAGTPGTEITDKQLAEWQRIVNAANDQFIAGVASGRRTSVQAIVALADGRVHPAAEALRLGLIDGVKSLDLVLSDMRKRTAGNSTGGRSLGATVVTALEGPVRKETEMSSDETSAAPTGSNSAAVAEQQQRPATLAELRAKYADDPAFALDAGEKALTMVEAEAAYAVVLRKQLQAAKTHTAFSPLGGSVARKGVGAEPTGDPMSDYSAAVAEKMKLGMDRGAAIRAVNKSNPDLHRSYLEATNPGRKQRELIADRFAEYSK